MLAVSAGTSASHTWRSLRATGSAAPVAPGLCMMPGAMQILGMKPNLVRAVSISGTASIKAASSASVATATATSQVRATGAQVLLPAMSAVI
ncbi:hypothetical protein D3C72_2354180 [compost metagenome]